MSAAPSKLHGSPGDYFWLKVWSTAGFYFAAACLVIGFVVQVVWGAAQFIPAPMETRQSLGSWKASIGNNGVSSYGTITRGHKAAGGVGRLCANCTMPSPDQLNDEQWMDLHLLYQTADPALVTEAGFVCDPGFVPTIMSVRTYYYRVGLWYGRIVIRCAK